MFALHDPAATEVFVYAGNADDGSAVYRKIRDAAEHFVDISGGVGLFLTKLLAVSVGKGTFI